jgi:hypothetical protein
MDQRGAFGDASQLTWRPDASHGDQDDAKLGR